MLDAREFNKKTVLSKNNSNKKAFTQLVIMMSLTILTQIISILKTSTIASQFGATVEMDAFNFSNSIGTFIFSFIGAGVTTVLIPNMVNKDKEEGINVFISILYSLAFIVFIAVYFLRRFIIIGLSDGSDQFINIASNIMFITLITQYINSFLGTTDAIFQCNGKFNFPKMINLILTTILVLLVILTDDLTINKYAFYIFVTTIANVIIQICLAIRGGYKYKYILDIKNEDFKKMFKIFFPTVLSTGLYQFSLLTDTLISSNLGEGSISILGYSNTLMTMVNAILLNNLMTYFYPKIAKSINKNNSQEKMFELMILLNGIMFLIVSGFYIVGKEGIMLLYERGKFTHQITEWVYVGTSIYMLGIPINAMRDLLYRYFYAKGDTLTPFKNSLVVSITNIVISIGLAKIMGIYGVILGTVLTSYMSFIMIAFKFNKYFKIQYSKRVLIIETIKLVVTLTIVVIIISFIRLIISPVNIILSIIVYGLMTVLLYGMMLILLKSKVLKIKL